MDFLARHYFDFQSLINLPHTAIQLHKTPPSQAGADPTAAWAPKSLHLAGKNQPAPAARANHNKETRAGSHRHGRPSKLEFRNWGDRHGELRPEKIMPHKDSWMETAYGSTFKHLYEEQSDDEESFLTNYIAMASQLEHHTECFMLVLLTANLGLDLVTLTVKNIKGISAGKLFLKVKLYEDKNLLEERSWSNDKSDHGQNPSEANSLEVGASFLLHVQPSRLPLCRVEISLYTRILKTRFGVAPSAIERGIKKVAPSFENLPIGIVTIGPLGTRSCGSLHWRRMFKKPGIPVCMWHPLKRTQRIRQMSLSPETKKGT